MDAWNALRGAGVSTRSEYDKIRDKERARERARKNRERNRRKREQLASSEHNPKTHPGRTMIYDKHTVYTHIGEPSIPCLYDAYTMPVKIGRANEREFYWLFPHYGL